MADRCLLAVFAHPDDETFRLGGTLVLLAQGCARMQVFTATRGRGQRVGELAMNRAPGSVSND